MGLAPVVIRTVSDGLIVGAYVGLGFQILEDVLYAQNVGLRPVRRPPVRRRARQLRAARGHRDPVARALHGAVRRRPDLPDRDARPAAADRPGSRAGADPGADPRDLGLRRGARRRDVRAPGPARRHDLLRRGDPRRRSAGPAVASGRSCTTSWPRRSPPARSPQAEFDALPGHRKERRAAVKRREQGVSRRREKHVLRAARDLAEDIARGDDAPSHTHARRSPGSAADSCAPVQEDAPARRLRSRRRGAQVTSGLA